MNDIKRWRSEHIWGDMRHEPDGEFVTYVDHEAEIASVVVSAADLIAEAKKEGYRLGVLDGNADTSAKLQDYYGEQAQGHYNDGYKMGYAKGLIEGDSGGRKEGFRVGYDTAWSLSAAEIERATEARVREEEQVAQTLARAELYSMEEMDERCTQAADEAFAVGVQAARDAVTAVQAERGYDAAINWSEIGNEYAEGWTDLLSLILPAIDAIIDEGRNTG